MKRMNYGILRLQRERLLKIRPRKWGQLIHRHNLDVQKSYLEAYSQKNYERRAG